MHAEDRLSDYLLGALPPAGAREVREHLAGCAHCQAELEEWSRLRRDLLALEDRPLPASLRARVMESIVAGRRPLRAGWLRPALAAAAAVLLAVGLTLAFSPRARASFGELLSRVRVVPAEEIRPTASPSPTPPQARGQAGTPVPALVPTESPGPAAAAPDTPSVTPSPTPSTVTEISELAGETTLAGAQSRTDFQILRPAVLGPEDHVFFQDFQFAYQVILVWERPGEPLVLYQSHGVLTSKGMPDPETLEEVEVSGRPALWVRGPHLVQFESPYGSRDRIVRLVRGNTLLWEAPALPAAGSAPVESVTYRLETDLPLVEAIRIGESLVEVP